jgi:hypothetical protein
VTGQPVLIVYILPLFIRTEHDLNTIFMQIEAENAAIPSMLSHAFSFASVERFKPATMYNYTKKRSQ